MNVLYKNESLKLNILTALCLVLLFTTYIKSSPLNLFGNYAMADPESGRIGATSDRGNGNDEIDADKFRRFVSILCNFFVENQNEYDNCESRILNNSNLLNEAVRRSYEDFSLAEEGDRSLSVIRVLENLLKVAKGINAPVDGHKQFASIFCEFFKEDQNGYDNCESLANSIPLEGTKIIYEIYQKVFRVVLDTNIVSVGVGNFEHLNDLESVQMPYFPSIVDEYKQFVSIFCKLFNEGQYDNCESRASDIQTEVIKEVYQRELHFLLNTSFSNLLDSNDYGEIDFSMHFVRNNFFPLIEIK